MKFKTKSIRFSRGFLLGILIFSMGYHHTVPHAYGEEEIIHKPRPFVIGKVSDNPKKHYRYLKPMADYLAKHLKDLGISEGKVLMAKNNRQMIDYIKRGRVDLITETPFSAVVFHDEAEAEFLVRKWKKGVPDYYSVIFVRKDSGINDIQGLKGKTIAFEDPGSTSAFFVPAATLIDEGMELFRIQSLKDSVPTGSVGYLFSGEEINTSTWVHAGVVSAGTFNNLDWEKDDHLPQLFRKDLKIIYKTKSFPRAIELVRKDLDPKIKARLKDILLDAHKDPHAKNVLESYQKTKKFDALNEKTMQALDEVRRLLEIVQSRLH